MQQEIFSFPKIETLDWSDFIESDENRRAILYLTKWPDWDSNGIIIHGESGTGKTHLAALWAQTANAAYILGESFNHNPRNLFDAECNFVIDNFDDSLNLRNYNWIFHFFNIAKEKNRFFLILSRSYPSLWSIGLEDLKSRLLALPAVNIDFPKDRLLLKISQKIAKDLGVYVSDDVLTYILNIVDRNVSTMDNVLRILDKLSIQRKKPLSLTFVKNYLESIL
jgi:chromosomal replication initiation ATPase DnaA